MIDQLSPTILQALGPLLNTLVTEGFVPTAVLDSPSFGDFAVTFSKGEQGVTICRDRGQFHVEGERDNLEPIGLWRSFIGVRELELPLMSWLRSRQHA